MRPVTKMDIPNFLIWMNDPEVTQYLNRYLPISEQEEMAWVDSLYGSQFGKAVVWCIEVIGETNRPIGTVGLHGIHPRNRHSTLGIMIGEKDCWNKQYGRRAINLALTYAFRELNIRKVCLTVIDFNERGQTCYEHCGFIEEGRKKEHVFGGGVYHDEIHMAVFQANWSPAPV